MSSYASMDAQFLSPGDTFLHEGRLYSVGAMTPHGTKVHVATRGAHGKRGRTIVFAWGQRVAVQVRS